MDADWAMAEGPHRVGQILLSIRLPNPVTPQHRERLLKVAHGCTVHQSITVAAAWQSTWIRIAPGIPIMSGNER